MTTFDADQFRGIFPIERSAVELALVALRSIKAPTKRAALIAQTITQLSTQAAVNEFTTELRRQAHVQDASIFPESTWKLSYLGNHSGSTPMSDRYTTAELREKMLANAQNVAIDWPSVGFHWGVRVTWDYDGEPGSWVAFSADYAMTETYLSS